MTPSPTAEDQEKVRQILAKIGQPYREPEPGVILFGDATTGYVIEKFALALATERQAAEEGQRSRIEEIIKDEIEHIKIMLEGAKGHILSGWMGSAETAETLLAAIRATGGGGSKNG